jgi:AcrR family transcriptional regulator
MGSVRPAPDDIEAHRRVRSRRGEGETLREDVLAAAERLLVASGSEDAVSIRAVAAAVGVSPAAIYLHFPDKDALMGAVCGRVFAQFDAALESAAAGASDPIDDLFRRGRAYVQFGLAYPGQYGIIFLAKKDGNRFADVPWDERPGSEAFTHLVEAVARAMDAGALRREDPGLVATGLWMCVHGLTSLLLTMPEFPWPPLETLVCHVIHTHLQGLAAAPEASPRAGASTAPRSGGAVVRHPRRRRPA